MSIEDILFDEFPEETLGLISKSAAASYEYAMRIAARFEMGEPAIMRHPKLACLYAINRIHGRWVEAEPAIARSSYGSLKYFERFRSGSADIHDAIVRGILKTKPEKRESRIMRYAYAFGGRLPDALHSMMILSGSKWYIEYLDERERVVRNYLNTLSREERSELVHNEFSH